ncbi:MAG: hypothetical protein LUC94_06940 [Clostridiales bacterium]|nr:hypothetical protein [Clostridiales bacterium]
MNKIFTFTVDQGLFYDGKWLADFNPQVLRKIVYIDISSDSILHQEFVVEIVYKNGVHSDALKLPRLKDIPYFDLWQCPAANLGKRRLSLLEYKLQCEALKAPEEKILVVRKGLQFYHQIPIMLLGNKLITGDEIAENTICFDKFDLMPYSKDNTYQEARIQSYINLFPGVSEILFYSALFSVIRPMLVAEKIKADFLTVIIGPSGHLKTTLANIFALWLKDTDIQSVNFRNCLRIPEIFKRMQNCSGLNYLIDDIHAASSGYRKDKQNDLIDMIVRNISDNLKGTNIWLTGEELSKDQLFSCRDRMLQIRIPKMNARQIAELQAKISSLDKGWMPFIACQFASALLTHYNNVLSDIQSFFAENSITYEKDTDYPTRIFQHGMFIRLTEFLFRKYICNGSADISGHEKLNDALTYQCKIQQAELIELQKKQEQRDYVMDVFNLLDSGNSILNGTFDKESYTPDNDQFLILNRRCYIHPIILQKALDQYLGQPVPMIHVKKALDSVGLLDRDIDSMTKKFHKTRHLVIYLPLLRKYANSKKTKDI